MTRISACLFLPLLQLGRDLDQVVGGPFVDTGRHIANVVQDVHHHGTIPAAHLEQDKRGLRIMLRKNVLGDRPPIVRLNALVSTLDGISISYQKIL